MKHSQFSTTLVLVTSLFTSGVFGHGFVSNVTIGDKVFPGPVPNSGTTSTIREIKTLDRVVTGATDPSLPCGIGAQPAKLVAAAKAGDPVKVFWVDGLGDTWKHVGGMHSAYLARCDNDDCTTFDASKGKYFKIAEQAKADNGSNVWALQDIGVGKTANFNLPGTLKTGSYIMRHELIAIHNAVKLGREEFYMGCMQLNVTNTAGNVVEPDSFVAFPGAYKDSDPGLFMPTLFDGNNGGINFVFPNNGSDYIIPGPGLSNVVTGKPTAKFSTVATKNGAPTKDSAAAPTTNTPSSKTTSSSSCQSSKKRRALNRAKRDSTFYRAVGTRELAGN